MREEDEVSEDLCRPAAVSPVHTTTQRRCRWSEARWHRSPSLSCYDSEEGRNEIMQESWFSETKNQKQSEVTHAHKHTRESLLFPLLCMLKIVAKQHFIAMRAVIVQQLLLLVWIMHVKRVAVHANRRNKRVNDLLSCKLFAPNTLARLRRHAMRWSKKHAPTV